VKPSEFNTFGLEWFPDKLVFTINGEHTMTYPKITTDKPGQWPFDQPFYLLIDMQLGGKWLVPSTNPSCRCRWRSIG
jgi:beta-glucanase (GH16 family)